MLRSRRRDGDVGGYDVPGARRLLGVLHLVSQSGSARKGGHYGRSHQRRALRAGPGWGLVRGRVSRVRLRFPTHQGAAGPDGRGGPGYQITVRGTRDPFRGEILQPAGRRLCAETRQRQATYLDRRARSQTHATHGRSIRRRVQPALRVTGRVSSTDGTVGDRLRQTGPGPRRHHAQRQSAFSHGCRRGRCRKGERTTGKNGP